MYMYIVIYIYSNSYIYIYIYMYVYMHRVSGCGGCLGGVKVLEDLLLIQNCTMHHSNSQNQSGKVPNMMHVQRNPKSHNNAESQRKLTRSRRKLRICSSSSTAMHHSKSHHNAKSHRKSTTFREDGTRVAL